MQEIIAKPQLHPTQVSTWKQQAIEGMNNFSDKVGKAQNNDEEIKEPTPRFGNWRWKIIFVIRTQVMSPSDRSDMIRKENPGLSFMRWCKLFQARWSCFLGQVCGIAKMHLVAVHAAFGISTRVKYAVFGVRLSREL